MRCTSVLCCVLTPAVPYMPGPGCVRGRWMQKAPRVLVNRSKNCFQAAEALCGKGHWRWCLRSYGWWGTALARQAVWGISEELPLSLEPTCVRRGESEGTHLCRRGRRGAELARPGVDAHPAQCWVLRRGSGWRQVCLEWGKGHRATVRKGDSVGKPLGMGEARGSYGRVLGDTRRPCPGPRSDRGQRGRNLGGPAGEG